MEQTKVSELELMNMLNDYVFYTNNDKTEEAKKILNSLYALTGIDNINDLITYIDNNTKSPNCFLQIIEYDLVERKRRVKLVNAKRIYYGYDLTPIKVYDIIDHHIDVMPNEKRMAFFKNVEEKSEMVSVLYGMYLH